MKFFKRLFWTLFLSDDWYFIRLHGENIYKPAFWNGVVWENRLTVIDDVAVASVGHRVPDSNRINERALAKVKTMELKMNGPGGTL